ncbi:MAG TPA: ATP-dependent DNA helicase RecG [Acidimicrobiales bacterium]
MSQEAPVAANSVRRRLSQLARIPVVELKTVGPKKSAALAQMNIHSVLDLLFFYPRKWNDRTNAVAIDALVPGEEAVVSAEIISVSTKRPRGRKPIVELRLSDGTGTLLVSFFNQPWRSRQLGAEMNVVVFGKVDLYRERLQMVNPIVDLIGDQTGRIVPIYPQSERAGIGSSELGHFVEEALRRAGDFADPLPGHLRGEIGLVDRTTAFQQIHAPEDIGQKGRARRRLAFDELFRLQLALVLKKRAIAAGSRGIAHNIVPAAGNDLVGAFLSSLPFALTDAQGRVIEEVAADLGSPLPMHRLLQGDVGAGKTVVALAALLYGVQGGHQGALMVPTEVLAEQHFMAAREMLKGVMRPDATRLLGERPLQVALLTSKTPAGERTRLLAGLLAGTVDILVGTHALITAEVRFARLGVVVIDEQHRFGVDQRAALREKGASEANSAHDPDLLVMTATPIPRTAAMTVYGDLDYSVLDEMPPGRTPIRTLWIAEPEDEARVWQRVRAEVKKGHQAFVVCPYIRPGEEDDAARDDDLVDDADVATLEDLLAESAAPRLPRAATTEFERLSSGELAGVSIGLLHGQLSAKEKERVMNAFRAGEISVLVATTVIEVGVDVPAATVMVIEDADRFGIAQLHQLRGRVGRGSAPSVCFLLGAPTSKIGIERLSALERTSDGFELAEVDLALRGEGTVLGARQRGRSDLRLASLRFDRDLIAAARRAAESIVDDDPGLRENRVLADELEEIIGEEAAAYVVRS